MEEEIKTKDKAPTGVPEQGKETKLVETKDAPIPTGMTPNEKSLSKSEGKTKKEETKKETKKAPEKPKIEKKDVAIVNGNDLPISTKYSIAICNFIRGNRIEEAVEKLEDVIKMKRAVPMTGEIPHRKGKGISSGRYPITACETFIMLLKSLASNSHVNLMENVYIETAKSNRASRPYRRFGSKRFKRTNVVLIAKEKKSKQKEKKQEVKVESPNGDDLQKRRPKK